LTELSCEAHVFGQDLHMKTVFEQPPPQFNEFVTSVSEKMLIHSQACRVLGLKALYMPGFRKTLMVGQMKLTNDAHVLRQRASHIDNSSVASYVIYVNPTKTMFYYN